ncbi:HAD-IIIC family phosphatase [uncultured Methylobacterium sp.]|uniref:HAD-IIIC family phosphatase n=1 Tax=uncultured Methylobacterium sp. TaxID=157278 RepID=UPI0035CB7352
MSAQSHPEPASGALPKPKAADEFRVPRDLRVSATGLNRLLVVGSCLVENLLAEVGRAKQLHGDFVLFNNLGELPASPPQAIAAYDLQIVQIPLRSILPDVQFARLKHHRPEDYELVFRETEERLSLFLDAAMRWNRETGITTFVVNFFRPQQDPLGRLMPRNDLRSFSHFMERLNARLADVVATYANSHVLDFDAIAATIGRMHVQDDHLWMLNHSSTLSDFDSAYDRNRLDPPPAISRQFDLRIAPFFDAVYAEIEAMVRTLRGIDAVKLVIVDLDDTLWRGVIAEAGEPDPCACEGWPLGLVEALCVLKTRGIVLAIASKNDEAIIRGLWDGLFGERLPLEQFAVVRINWNAKADNVAEILEQVNVLPESAVFIDDNPVERDAVRRAFPGIRTLGADLYGIRRTLLWSAETQGPFISDESGRRTEMIQAQVRREDTRKALSREEFLASLNIRITPCAIGDAQHGRFRRAFELINKTNQFNTTGRRWTVEDMGAAFRDGLTIHAFEVADKFTDYGLVGAAVVMGDAIVQVVMSCRVFGLDIETAMLAHLTDGLRRAGHAQVSALFVATDRNKPCADLYAKAGFDPVGDRWVRALT